MKLPVMEILVVLLTAAGIYCGWRYYSEIYLPEKQIDTAIQEQKKLFSHIRPEFSAETDSIFPEESFSDMINTTNSETIPETTETLLAPCEEINHRTTGWIYIPDTNIDYPVVQGEDNEFYLHNGFDGEYNYELGCPFLDYRCKADFSGFSSIVYAHNIENRAMFADIALYKNQEFMQSHPSGCLLLDNSVHTVDFFAYLTVSSNDLIYYALPETETECQEYTDYLLKSANYSFNPEINKNDHLLLLSTCTFEYDEARGVLAGVIR